MFFQCQFYNECRAFSAIWTVSVLWISQIFFSETKFFFQVPMPRWISAVAWWSSVWAKTGCLWGSFLSDPSSKPQLWNYYFSQMTHHTFLQPYFASFFVSSGTLQWLNHTFSKCFAYKNFRWEFLAKGCFTARNIPFLDRNSFLCTELRTRCVKEECTVPWQSSPQYTTSFEIKFPS